MCPGELGQSAVGWASDVVSELPLSEGHAAGAIRSPQLNRVVAPAIIPSTDFDANGWG